MSVTKRLARLAADWAMVPPVGTAYIEPIPSFHPPSLKNPDIIPVDEPMERSNKHLTRFMRDSMETWKFRLRLIKNMAPTEAPYAVKTAVEMHQGVLYPFLWGQRGKKNGKAIQARKSKSR